MALSENPNITAARHALDAAQAQVRLVEGELLPTLGVQGSVNHRYDVGQSGDRRTSAQVVARLDVPLYQAGEVSARVRQAKEIAQQRRFDVEFVRDQVRADVIAAWGQFEASTAQIEAAQAQVSAAETALTGVREEARVGQRTTLDVLNAQQELLNARVTLITSQRDRRRRRLRGDPGHGPAHAAEPGAEHQHLRSLGAFRAGPGPLVRDADAVRRLNAPVGGGFSVFCLDP